MDEGISPEHVINLRGKKYITHAGLLDKAHKIGLLSIETKVEACKPDELVMVRARVIIKDKDGVERRFSAIGDATPSNVTPQIRQHIIRMAETRAVNRALRFATNIGMTSIEELDEAKTADEQ